MEEEWEEFEEEIKKIEEEFGDSGEVLKLISEPVSGEYWRKKYTQEKDIYGKLLEKKEEEKKVLEAKLEAQGIKIRSLEEELKNVKKTYEAKLKEFEEDLKRKEVERVLEHEKAILEERIKELGSENNILKAELNSLKEIYENEKSSLVSAYKSELEEIVGRCEDLTKGIEEMEEKFNNLELKMKEDFSKIENEKQELEREKKDKEEKLILLEEKVEEKEECLKLVSSFFISGIKKMFNIAKATIFQSNIFTKSVPILFRWEIAKEQLTTVSAILDKIYALVDEYTENLLEPVVKLQETQLNRFLFSFKVQNEDDIFNISEEFKIKVDSEKIQDIINDLSQLSIPIFEIENRKVILKWKFSQPLPIKKFLEYKRTISAMYMKFSEQDGEYLIKIPII